jgi:hypothetical protein
MILHGDCLDRLKELDSDSVDAIVTDPPYGISFMNRKWDYDVPSVEVWRECLRVLKPGGHMLAFGGPRTYHRLAVAIEDAGFEIRDQIQWIFGSGFPKSLDISKAIDKAAGATREVVGRHVQSKQSRKLGNALEGSKDGSLAWQHDLTAPATDAAKKWQGWGTALKPANEPICLARKPLGESTVAKNVLKHGTGGLNIEACRIATTEDLNGGTYAKNAKPQGKSQVPGNGIARDFVQPVGRFPANLILDEEAGAALDAQSGTCSYNPSKIFGKSSGGKIYANGAGIPSGADVFGYGDSGGASRFFYCAKTSASERNAGLGEFPLKQGGGMSGTADKTLKTGSGNERDASYKNHHPTVKPLKLMRYLCRLITPPGGTVLDPFTGSGSTLVAAKQEGFQFVGIERESEYVTIARKRVESAEVTA